MPAASGARCAAQYARDGKDVKLLVDLRRVWARGDDSRPWLEAETGNDAAAAAGFAAAAVAGAAAAAAGAAAAAARSDPE